MNAALPEKIRTLVIVLGDQLDMESVALRGLDPAKDVIWMAEVAGESTYVWSSKIRTTLFVSAMRHFREALLEKGYSVLYTELGSKENKGELDKQLDASLEKYKPETIKYIEPGEHRLLKTISSVCKKNKIDFELLEDDHFLASHQDFETHAEGRKQLRMEFFYREIRKRYKVLIEDGKPAGGEWNFDSSNRQSFGKQGPELMPQRRSFKPDDITKTVIKLVNESFEDHPGDLENFNWPVTRKEALQALEDFIEDCLPNFGKHQDAMWTAEPFLNHSLISSSLNLKLLNPREVIKAAEKAYRDGKAPIESVEGFIRQILGWREYVRGIYWLYMPAYLECNALNAQEALPDFYWTGETSMRCMNDCITQTMKHGYAHHIQRLMVTGLFSLMYGINPKKIHAWYLAVYVDAVEWVELPNTLGMSQYGDGGVTASKPYVATGKYIQRMSNYCSGCQYNPAESVGENACPFTTLYWDFLMRHENALKKNNRMAMQLRNLNRLSEEKKDKIQDQAKRLRCNKI
jgi:deoxyribodipyrimidine photolyase-related protein